MYDYTNLPKEKYYSVEYVDYDIEMIGLTIDKILYTGIIFFLLIGFLGPIRATLFTIIYVITCKKIYKLELEGRPITFNPKIQKYLRKFPKFLFLKHLTYIELSNEKYRT